MAEYREGPLRQVNLTTGAIGDLGTADLRPSYDVAVDTAAGYAYVGDKEFHLWRVNVEDGDTEMLISNTVERTEALALSPDGATLYAGQRGAGRLLAIDLATRKARPLRDSSPSLSGSAVGVEDADTLAARAISRPLWPGPLGRLRRPFGEYLRRISVRRVFCWATARREGRVMSRKAGRIRIAPYMPRRATLEAYQP